MHNTLIFNPDFESVTKEGRMYNVRGDGYDPRFGYYEDTFVFNNGFVRSRYVSQGPDQLTPESVNAIRSGVTKAVRKFIQQERGGNQ